MKFRLRLGSNLLFPTTCLGNLLLLFFGLLSLLFYAEVLHHLLVIGFTCKWPDFTEIDSPDTLRILIAADPHLLGFRFGGWFDKLRREWAMKRSYHAAYNLIRPAADATFVLGDLTDEGEFASMEKEFSVYKARFDAIFHPESYCPVISLVGNHDVGFHYKHFMKRQQMFDSIFVEPEAKPASSARLIRLKSVEFVLLNSVAFEGDHDKCKLCDEARQAVEKISKRVNNPILLQHFPLYRPNDLACPIDVHAAIEPLRSEPTRPRLDVLSREASAELLEKLEPRLVISGHTHFSCKITHEGGVEEFSVPSFSWRNNKAPAMMLLVANSERFAIERCALADERTIFAIYGCGGVFLAFWCMLRPLLMCCWRCCFRSSASAQNKSHVSICPVGDGKAKQI